MEPRAYTCPAIGRYENARCLEKVAGTSYPMGQYLVYDDVYIVCENNSYGVYRNDDDSLTDTVTISQNEAGIDTEDRIIKLKKYIANMK